MLVNWHVVTKHRRLLQSETDALLHVLLAAATAIKNDRPAHNATADHFSTLASVLNDCSNREMVLLAFNGKRNVMLNSAAGNQRKPFTRHANKIATPLHTR